MSKLYEIMGDDGLPTGRMATAKEVREEKLKVRYAQVLLFNARGELLVQQRSRLAKARPNLLDPSAAGHVEPGQTFLDCALMEMEEEIGVKTPLEFGFSYRGAWGFAEVFKGIWDGDVTIQPDEVERAVWLRLDVLDVIMRETPWLASDGFVSTYAIFRGWRKNDE
jgi:isopentenyldiphosphate isomerase